jgi:repressor LexA
MATLTPRQQQIFDLIRDTIRNGLPTVPRSPPNSASPPQFGRGTPAALARKGVIELTPGASRGIRLKVTRSDSERPDQFRCRWRACCN